MLAAAAHPEDIHGLIEAYQSGDPLTQKLSLRILASMHCPESTAFLVDCLEQGREEFLDIQQVLLLLRNLRGVPRSTARAMLFDRLAELFKGRADAAVRSLQQAEAADEAQLAPAIDALKSIEKGWHERFVLEASSLLALGKVARYSAFESETIEGTEGRLEQLTTLLDQCAELLAFQVDQGSLPLAEALPHLHALFQVRAGSEGASYAFLRLVPPDATGILDEVLGDPDIERRMRYMDALGTREDDALTPFFMKAAQDSIIEVGQKAIHHLGKLPSSLPLLLEMFQSGQPEQVRRAIRVFGENLPKAAADVLMEFIQKDSRDNLVLEAVEALARIVHPPAASVYLELLHDGKPLNLQIALTQALGFLATPEASLGLLAKAPVLKAAPVLILALEGTLNAFTSFSHPLPLEHLESLMHLLDRCCDEREGEGNRLRAMLAMEGLFIFSQVTYERLRDRFGDYLSEMRTKEVWDKDNNDRVAALLKELNRRSESLRMLSEREKGLLHRLQQVPPKGPPSGGSPSRPSRGPRGCRIDPAPGNRGPGLGLGHQGAGEPGQRVAGCGSSLRDWRPFQERGTGRDHPPDLPARHWAWPEERHSKSAAGPWAHRRGTHPPGPHPLHPPTGAQRILPEAPAPEPGRMGGPGVRQPQGSVSHARREGRRSPDLRMLGRRRGPGPMD